MVTLEQERKFIELRAQSWSFDKIAKELGVSKPTLIKLSRKYAARITRLKEIELDELMETQHLSTAKKVETCGSMLQSIKKVLDQRDLNALPTVELIKLQERYLKMGKNII